MSKRRLFISSIAAAGLVAALALPVLGTPPSGILSGPILARGDFTAATDVKFKISSATGTEVSNVAGAGEVVMQRIELAPSGSTGWHTHPGPAVVIIQSGSLVIESEHDGSCQSTTFAAGQSFVDAGQGHVHLGRNPSTTVNTVVFVTYFDVGAAGPRLNADAPGAC